MTRVGFLVCLYFTLFSGAGLRPRSLFGRGRREGSMKKITYGAPCSNRANAEIAQVRGKAQQEQAAYQASLRKEQLRVDALERTLEQKVRGSGSGTHSCESTRWFLPVYLVTKAGKLGAGLQSKARAELPCKLVPVTIPVLGPVFFFSFLGWQPIWCFSTSHSSTAL